ncbi:MAG: GNAT family N-acetyltransferase [Methanomassiliicoccus sp.]|nr:GNAT family N-acetyltransferase [Methanomassiliicoccus sp.]
MGRYTDGELVQAIETTYYDDMVSFCADANCSFLRRDPDIIIYSTGLPIAPFNGVLNPRFGCEDAAQRVRDAMAHFQNARMPMSWVLGPSSTPQELDEFLLRLGMAQGPTEAGMAADLGSVGREPLPRGLEIRRVEDSGSMKEFIDTTIDVFELPERARAGWDTIIMNYGFGPSRHWFLGTLDGRPVSTSLLVLHENVASMYMVGTIRGARGQGIGTAMTRESLLFAREAGMDIAVLEASELGLPIYERMGFRKLCEFRIFSWTPSCIMPVAGICHECV